MNAHGALRLGVDERLELLAAGVLLHVTLERLHRAEDLRPRVGRNRRDRQRRPRDVRQDGWNRSLGRRHQNFCPQTRCPTISTTAHPVMSTVNNKKNLVAGPAASLV